MEAIDVSIQIVWQSVFLEWETLFRLVERAQEQFDEEEAKKLQKKIAKNEFGFDDFLTQIQQVKKMGNMKDLVGMIPGASKAMKDVEIEDDAFKHIEAIIHSMTPKERSKPSIIDVKRKTRIAKGSGRKFEAGKSIDEAIRPNEQNDENDARSGGKNLMKMMGGMKGMPGGMPR
jgi:signal recognition particle subunit SRP54